MCAVQAGDSLRGIRRSIVEFFQDTGREEEPDSDSELDDDDDDFSGPEYNFLRENRFTFHLNGGETQVDSPAHLYRLRKGALSCTRAVRLSRCGASKRR